MSHPFLSSQSANSYQICTRCIMDTSDPTITFDAHGVCNHCTAAVRALDAQPKGEAASRALDQMLDKVRAAGRGKAYDCIIGLSGGADSSWLVHCARDWGLRPLLFHVDGGWNTEVAEGNIRKLTEKLGYATQKYTVDWEEMKDLQRAFLKAGVPNQDVPQDHLFFAVLFRTAAKYGIRYWFSGSNLATESILPQSWGYDAMDGGHVRAIHKLFGSRPLATFPVLSFYEYCRFYLDVNALRSIHVLKPLNLLDYDVFTAKETLKQAYGWLDYGKKHYESRFTKYLQASYLPVHFGFDKRRPHLSSLIASGLMTREQALAEMEMPTYNSDELAADTAYLCERLGFAPEEWKELLDMPRHAHRDYPTSEKSFERLTRAFRVLGAVRRFVKNRLHAAG